MSQAQEKPPPVELDLGELTMPEPQRLDIPWVFRAACHIKDPEVVGRVLHFGLVLDCGFHLYKQIECFLEGVLVVEGHEALAVAFAESWASCGAPNWLEVWTLRDRGFDCPVHVHRFELDGETLQVSSRTSLADELREQGLVVRLEDVDA